MEVRGSNTWPFVPQARRCRPLGHSIFLIWFILKFTGLNDWRIFSLGLEDSILTLKCISTTIAWPQVEVVQVTICHQYYSYTILCHRPPANAALRFPKLKKHSRLDISTELQSMIFLIGWYKIHSPTDTSSVPALLKYQRSTLNYLGWVYTKLHHLPLQFSSNWTTFYRMNSRPMLFVWLVFFSDIHQW